MMVISFWNLISDYKVVIPILQRDYAQGRNIGKVPLIRDNILNAFCNAIKSVNNPLELDFVYGYTKVSINDNGLEIKTFLPLDGQQRLTTLYLLYWFIAVKEGHQEEAKDVLSNFSYETRHSSRVFCSELVNFKPDDFEIPIKQSIINEPWFFTAWNNDPTIQSMLTMLNAIQEKVSQFKLDNVWESLISDNAPITFHILPMDKLGLPDDLYIKMNSRGKELTDFEYFKIRFSDMLSQSNSAEFTHNIDQTWSDLFWDLYKDEKVYDIAQKVDAGFLRFFRFITDIIIAKSSITPDSDEEYEVFKLVYSTDDNVNYLFKVLDKFVDVYILQPGFFSSLFYVKPDEYEIDKTRIFFVPSDVDLFKKCSDYYDTTQRINLFSIGEQLLLYACIIHLLNNSSDFTSRIRKLRNLIVNSEDTVRKENLPFLLNSIFELIVNDNLDVESKFNKTQIKEEIEKAVFIKQNSSDRDILNRLEDHHLLQGCTAIFKFTPELPNFAAQFHKVFQEGCDYDLISCALLTFGDYSQKIGWKRKLGNKNNSDWHEFFEPSQRRGDFANTQDVLYKLLDQLHKDPDISLQTIIRSYLTRFDTNELQEKDWIFYFIKYPEFRKHEDGYYYWRDHQKQFECIMMRRKTFNGFHWDPFLLAIKKYVGNKVSSDDYGAPLTYVKGKATLKIFNKNEGFKIEAADEDGLILLNSAINAGIIDSNYVCLVKQSTEGLDIENRITKGIKMIDLLNNL